MLRSETARALADWIYQDVLCRWGALSEIVSDNGAPFVKANAILEEKYHVRHIRISGYNSRANGTVEKPHFDVRQALFKASGGDQTKWSSATYAVFWADRVTIRKRIGVSPYFVVTGTHPILPMDIVEATYLLPPPDALISTLDLIASRAIVLQKRDEDLDRLHNAVFDARNRAARRFEEIHARTIHDYDFKLGDLVLVRNTAIEKSLNRKMRTRYLGPLVVVSRNRGGAYIIAELDGTVFDRPIARFCVIPYLARSHIAISNFSMLDVPDRRIHEMESSDDDGVESDDDRDLVEDIEDAA